MGQEAKVGRISSGGEQWSRFLPYVLLAIGFVLIAFYGTAVYNYFIPTVVQKRDFSLGVSTLAVIGGIAGFLSPCAFGMLPAYFAYFLSVDTAGATRGSNVRKAFKYGLATALGMITVAVVLAILILALGATFPPGLRVVTPIPNPYTRIIRILAGILLIILAIQQWRGRSIGLGLTSLVGRAQDRTDTAIRGSRSPVLSFYLYGLLYVLVAMPCVANVMAAPLLVSLATGGIASAVVTEFLFLLTMATLMVIVSILIGLASQTVLAKLRDSAPMVLRAASVLMAVMGLALIYLDLNLATFRSLFFHFPIK
jgi:cytochrome c-type biogenesis protein